MCQSGMLRHHIDTHFRHRRNTGHNRARAVATQIACDLRGYIIDCSETYPVAGSHALRPTIPPCAESLARGEYVIEGLGYKGDGKCVHTTSSFDKHLQELGFPANARLRARGVFLAFHHQGQTSIASVRRSYCSLKHHLNSRGDRSFTFISRLACALYNHSLQIRQQSMREAEWYSERVETLYK